MRLPSDLGLQPTQMTHFPAAAIFLVGSTLSAWLRFDKGALVVGWIVMLVCIAGVMVTWWLEARRAPRPVLPGEVQELGARDPLTPDEEQRFVDALRAHHRHTQREVRRDVQRQGPGALIGPRAAFYYFCLCVFALAVLPPTAVPSDVLPRLPRFVLVLTLLALAVMTVAVPLGLRDWRRVVRSLEDSTDA
jgi:hypothetical protein